MEMIFGGAAGVGWVLVLVLGFLVARKGADTKELEDKAARLKDENEKLLKAQRNAESTDAPVAVVAAQAEAEAHARAAAEAREELETLRAQLEEAARWAQDYEGRAKQAVANAETATARVQELEAESERLGTANHDLMNQVASLEAKLQEAASVAAEGTNTDSIPVSATSFNAEIEAERQAALEKLTVVEAEVQRVQAELAAAVTTRDTAVQERETLLAERENAFADRDRLTEERAALAAQIENLTTAVVEAQAAAETARAEAAAAAERSAADSATDADLEAAEKRIQRLQEFAEQQVGKLMTENRELKARLEASVGLPTPSADGAAERLLSLASLAPFGVFEADTNGQWKFVNNSWMRTAGLTAEASLGDGWKKSIHEADRAGVETAWGVMISAGTPFSRTFRLVTPDQQTRWVALRAGLVTVNENRTIVGVVEDITERRRSEESARSSAICLRSVVDASMESIVFLDRRGDITSWNRSAERMFGYSEEEALGRSLMALLVPDDQAILRRALAKAAQTDQLHTPQLVEGLALCKTGVTMPTEISVAGWRGGEFGEEDADIRYTATIRDISERRRAEDFRRDKEAAEEANRAKSQFLANMSHELRTPLNAIIGFSEILHDRTFGDLTPKQERYVGNILSSGRHLLQLINDILDLSKVESGHVALEYVAFPVAVAIRNVEGLVKVLLQKKGLAIETEVPADLPVLIADQAKFKQILYNLVSNAVKFTPEGGRITITATPLDGGKVLQIAVADTGIGIKPEDQERIFREFEQVDSTYARMQQGTGLGLALVRRFVEMHGGRIRVFSEGEGKGTTFVFAIPFAPPDEESSEETANQAAAVTAEAQKPSVLVVDDDQAASELLTHHLQVAGYTVSRAFTGADAIALARETNPGVMTLDVQLPDRDGWAILEAIKKDPATSNIPVLMVSIIEDRERALALGAAECFVKPVVKDRLLAAIAREIQARGKREGTLPAETPAVMEEEDSHPTVLMGPNTAPSKDAEVGGGAEAAGRKRSTRSRTAG